MLNEMIVAAGGALGIGGLGGSLIAAFVGRRGRKADALEKLEGIATRLADKATAAADKRVAEVEAKLAEIETREVRRRLAATLHMQWDTALADQVRQLGGEVPPPPPLEVM
ncbi:hypothetical protein [Nocardia sp. CNY236]|uniref:hypothetical protein n=1 Tax=Nocardia sp. CNY236 TaxID=1169152 RepID=UPI00040564E8|nr:hypothetical protein [Nocardia sp. CNY236]